MWDAECQSRRADLQCDDDDILPALFYPPYEAAIWSIRQTGNRAIQSSGHTLIIRDQSAIVKNLPAHPSACATTADLS
jgi:hypothetical protein